MVIYVDGLRMYDFIEFSVGGGWQASAHRGESRERLFFELSSWKWNSYDTAFFAFPVNGGLLQIAGY